MSFLSSPWTRRVAAALGCAAAVYGMVYVDLVLRARSAYREGERYMRWHEHPEEKRAFHEAELKSRTEALAADLAAGRIDRETHDLKLELARFRAEEAAQESSLKYAYVWFQSAVELFSPPESSWVVSSRKRMAEARELWKAELKAKGIPFEEYMLE